MEDDDAIRDVVRQVLEIEGYIVMTAANGREGVEILKKGSDRPDMILLDLMMPVMNGWQFLETKLLDADLASIPVIVLSAGTKVKPEGATAFFSKPIHVDELLKVAETYCPTCA